MSYLQKGFTLIELSVALIMVAMITSYAVPTLQNYNEEQAILLDGEQVKYIGDAAVKYVEDNYSALMAIATPTQPALVTVPMLVASGYLKSGTTGRNSFSQDVCVLVKEPSAGKLQGLMVTEGGTAIDDINVGLYAGQLGGAGGAVRAMNPAVIVGLGGSWSLNVSEFSGLVNDAGVKCDGVTSGNVLLTPGHAVMALWFAAEDKASGVLYRSAVPNRPELNQMNTSIDMNGNNIDGAATVTATTGTFSGLTSTTGNIGTVNAATANITGIANAGRVDTSIMYDKDNYGYYVNPSSTTMLNAARANIYYDKTNPGYYLRPASSSRLNSTYSNYAHSYGNMTAAGSITSTGVMAPGWANENWGCSPTGAIARKKWSGETLSCQSGRWKSQGGGYLYKSSLGYHRAPSGFLTQWGRNYMPGGARKCFGYRTGFSYLASLNATPAGGWGSGGGQYDYWGTYSASTTGFCISNDYDGGRYFYWQAIGW